VIAPLAGVKAEFVLQAHYVARANALSGYREPAQWIHGVNVKHGITWRMNVKLRHENERCGPKRYRIDGGRDVGPLKS
jgi:hypothetical protein